MQQEETGAKSAPNRAVIVRAVASDQELKAVVELTGSSFPEECGTLEWKGGAGLTLRQWADIEYADLARQQHLWRQIGLAVEQTGEGERVLGAVVLSFENEKDTGVTYWEVSRRVGCLATVHNWMYDQILEEPLKPHECLIDFIAVSPAARGKGVGALLMRWAQDTGAAILGELEPEAVAAHGPLMSLWVAADNTAAHKLYLKTGYEVTYKTDDRLCNCLMSRLFKSFLGHAVWHKMSKQLPIPAASALVKPQQAYMDAIPVSAVAVAAAPAAGETTSQTASAVATVASGCGACAAAAATAGPAQAPELVAPAECVCRIPAHNAQAAALPPPAAALPPPAAALGKSPCTAELPAGAGEAPAPCSLLPLEPIHCKLDLVSSSSNSSRAAALSNREAATLVRTLSNSAAAASIAHLMRRASEGGGTCGALVVAPGPQEVQ